MLAFLQSWLLIQNYPLGVLGELLSAVTLLGISIKLFGWLHSFFMMIKRGYNEILYIAKELRPNGGASMSDSLRRIENGIMKSEERQKILLNMLDYGIFETDDKGGITFVNKTLLRWTKRPESELWGESWINSVITTQRQAVINEWNNAILHKRNLELEVTFVDSENNAFSVILRTYPINKVTDTYPNAHYGWLGVVHRK